MFDIWVPVLVFSPFMVDATVTLFRRLFRGEKVWRAHREHYYQRLVLAGWGHRKTVLAEYGLMIVCGMGALLYEILAPSGRLTLFLGFILLYSSLMLGVRGVERRERSFHVAVSEKMDPR
jgi:hypothetical protein